MNQKRLKWSMGLLGMPMCLKRIIIKRIILFLRIKELKKEKKTSH